MKLYVMNSGNQKVYLNLNASTRAELINLVGGYNFYLGTSLHSVYDVKAEKDINGTATGAVVGGVVGALGGPIGILIGGFVGGLVGNNSDEEEGQKVNRFNNS